jgi:hypothetical protein
MIDIETLKKWRELGEESSMLNWWPKLKNRKFPLPKTVMLAFTRDQLDQIYNSMDSDEPHPLPESQRDMIIESAREIGYPLFMRTDQASGKHDWVDTCYVPNEESLIPHMYNLIWWHRMADMFGGLDWHALVFRELLDLGSTFTAFHGMPVAAERRYFVRDGDVICHHSYWVKEAIVQGSRATDLPKDWRSRLKKLNEENRYEILHLTDLAEKFSSTVNRGFWSVDFARDVKGNWWLIDAARGEISWHPKECPYYEHLGVN